MKRRILLLSALAMLGMATLPTYAQNKIVVKIAGVQGEERGEPSAVVRIGSPVGESGDVRAQGSERPIDQRLKKGLLGL